MESVLATMATSNAHNQVQLAVSVEVLKNQQEQQEMQAQALVKMISSSSLDGTGQLVNRTA